MEVTARARRLDVIGLSFILIGTTCFLIASAGLSRLNEAGVVIARPGQAFGAVREWQLWALLWWGGLALIAGGVVIAVWAAIHHQRGNGDMRKGNGATTMTGMEEANDRGE